jgi:metallo-beta-lactamase class B
MRKAIAKRVLALATALLFGIASQAPGQDRETLAKNPKLFVETAAKLLGWNDPAEPTKIVGPLYFVGTKGLGVWLIRTSEGHILLNTGMPSSGPMIEASIRKLGLKPEDVKLLLTCHAHIDHVGGHAYIKKISGAQVAMIDAEKDLLQTGGKIDFHSGAHAELWFEPVTVDRVFRDGDRIKLGDVALTARLTPGHTKGGTTWIMHVVDDGKIYNVVFPDGTSINPGYQVAMDPSYPGIGDDYRRTLHTLELLKPDIWLASHTEMFDFEGKRARAATEGVKAWVDPEGYRLFVAAQREKFEAKVNKEMGVPAKTK